MQGYIPKYIILSLKFVKFVFTCMNNVLKKIIMLYLMFRMFINPFHFKSQEYYLLVDEKAF